MHVVWEGKGRCTLVRTRLCSVYATAEKRNWSIRRKRGTKMLTFITGFGLGHGTIGYTRRLSGRRTRATTLRPGRARLTMDQRGGEPDAGNENERQSPSKEEVETERLQRKKREMEELLDAGTIAELDEAAEQWIGSDLTKWEWYERLKSRRERMTVKMTENESRMEEELQELRRTMLEVDELFGTGMIDSEANISPFGWGSLVTIMILYVGVGYALVNTIVHAVMAYLHSTSFP